MIIAFIWILVYWFHLRLKCTLNSELLVDLSFQLCYLLQIQIKLLGIITFPELLLHYCFLEYGQPFKSHLDFTLQVRYVEYHFLEDHLHICLITVLYASLYNIVSKLIIHHKQQFL